MTKDFMSVRLCCTMWVGELLFPYPNWPPQAKLSWLKLALPESIVGDTIVLGSLDGMSPLPAALATEKMLSLRSSREGERPDTEWIPCCRLGTSELWPGL